jgi:hypothetical protein
MKKNIHHSSLLFALGLLLFLMTGGAASAQQAKFADFDIVRSDVTVTLKPTTFSADVTAKVQLVNYTKDATATSLTLRLTKAAKLNAFSVNGTAASTEERKQPGSDQQTYAMYSATSLAAIPPGGTVTATMQYTLTFKESTNFAAITPGDCVLLPEANWTPFVHPTQTAHGADTAPYTLTVTGADANDIQSDGARTDAGGAATFTQTLAGRPWLVASSFDKPVTRTFTPTGGKAVTITVVTQAGLNAGKQAERVAEEAEKALTFYANIFGSTPTTTYTVISTPRKIIGDRRSPELRGREYDTVRGVRFIGSSGLLIDDGLFRRDTLDADTIEFLVRGAARPWLGGAMKLRGKGLGVVGDALPSWMGAVYFETRFNSDAAREYWIRRTLAYARMAAVRDSSLGYERGIDAPLAFQTPEDGDYETSTLNKGAIVFRLLERRIGRDKLLAAAKKVAETAGDAPALETLRATVVGTPADETLATFFKQWFDDLSEPDFVIGLPFKNDAGTGWTCALRNFGTGDGVIPVIAVTDKGETLTATATVPSKSYGTVEFKTTANIVRVELDPEKLYPQVRFGYDKNSKQFDNDSRPERTSAYSLFSEADQILKRRLKVGEPETARFAEAEPKLAAALEQMPNFTLARAYYARALAAQGKFDAAVVEAGKVNKSVPTALYPAAVAALVEGDAAAAKKNEAAAFEAYRRAVNFDAGVELDDLARRGMVAAEAAMGKTGPIDADIKTFIGQMDQAVRTGTATALEPYFIRPDTPKFVLGIVVSKPDNWTTQILRQERLSSTRVVLDVRVEVVTATKEVQTGSGVIYLRRTGSGWLIERLDQFTLKKKS